MTASKPVARKPDLIFYGGPASGKTTQVLRLTKTLKANPIFVGERLRAIAQTDTDLGRSVAARINKGKLVSHRLMVNLLKQWVADTPEHQMIVSDGAPRDMGEVLLYDRILKAHGRHSIAIYLKLPLAVAKDRILARAKKEKRADDMDPSAVKSRIQLFTSESKEILEYYKKHRRLITVDANKPIAQLEKEILTRIKTWV